MEETDVYCPAAVSGDWLVWTAAFYNICKRRKTKWKCLRSFLSILTGWSAIQRIRSWFCGDMGEAAYFLKRYWCRDTTVGRTVSKTTHCATHMCSYRSTQSTAGMFWTTMIRVIRLYICVCWAWTQDCRTWTQSLCGAATGRRWTCSASGVTSWAPTIKRVSAMSRFCSTRRGLISWTASAIRCLSPRVIRMRTDLLPLIWLICFLFFQIWIWMVIRRFLIMAAERGRLSWQPCLQA